MKEQVLGCASHRKSLWSLFRQITHRNPTQPTPNPKDFKRESRYKDTSTKPSKGDDHEQLLIEPKSRRIAQMTPTRATSGDCDQAHSLEEVAISAQSLKATQC